MNTTRRPYRLFWLLGIALLVGTAAGAGWVLNHAPAGTPVPSESTRQRAQAGADCIICIGYVDVPLGTTPLYPMQPGRVREVLVQEGDEVKKDAVLFRMDDHFARTRLDEAEADLKAAEALQAKAERERRLHKLRIDGQVAAVEAAQANAKAQASVVAAVKKLREASAGGSAEELAAAEEKENAAKKLIVVEAAKLQGLKDYDFGPELRLAAANIQAKKAVHERAQLALTECTVLAPTAGKVLRLFITPNQILGAEPRLPAVQFCPAVARIVRAEVMQEWGARVKAGQLAVIEDDTRAGFQWTGRVQRKSDWYSPRRHKLQEPFQFNDVRTLECIVAVDPGQPHMQIGQKMRVLIKQGGP